MRKWWHKHYCMWCKKHVVFPTVHFVLHILDALYEVEKKRKINGGDITLS